jgi:hypothetical protein
MALMLVCVLLALVGVAAIAAWGTLGIEAPAAEAGGGRAASAVRRYLWWANLVISGGLVTGICAAGAGGRLVMRLLAATSPDARGAVTEADQTVGEITVGGTLGFLLFAALPLAILASVAFAFSYRWLPRGRLAGLLYGLLLLVVLGSRFEPLRSNNPDFRLLEPAWLAVVAFALLVLADGMLTAAFMSWYSRRLPLPAGHRGVLLYYLWPVPLVLILFVVLVPVRQLGQRRQRAFRPHLLRCTECSIDDDNRVGDGSTTDGRVRCSGTPSGGSRGVGRRTSSSFLADSAKRRAASVCVRPCGTTSEVVTLFDSLTRRGSGNQRRLPRAGRGAGPDR